MSFASRTSSNLIKSLSVKRTFSSSRYRSQHHLSATPEQFKKAIADKDKVVLVDFFAEWCGPCKQLTPVLKQVIPSSSSTIDLITLDTDDHYELASEYKISALPTVIAFKEGKQLGKFVGGRNEAGVKQFLQEIGA